MAKQLDNIPGLKQDGGWELMAKHSGVWPIYGYLHPEIRRIVDEQGEEVLPKYGKSVKMKVNPFPHWQAAKDVESAEGEFTLVVHASDYHGEIDITANDKLIMEMTLANHLHINYETAKHLNIHGGDLIRVTSKSGYLVTRAHTTQTIRPDVVAMHREGGHWSMGGIANGYFHPEDETHSQSYFHSAHDEIDDDATHNLWWDDIGVQPMDIILPVFDEKGGGAATATSVTVTKAELGDEYGTIEVDAEA
jgi:anaerobic selenocysteine-containing dehydrogenase